jgi:dUTP pyrophosphatase
MPRSSVSKYNLVLCNSVGLVDESYRGEIRARFKYIAQAEDMIISQVCDHKGYSFPLEIKINKEKIYKKGDKIAQLVISPTFEAEFVFVENLDETERGSGGFGSSGK